MYIYIYIAVSGALGFMKHVELYFLADLFSGQQVGFSGKCSAIGILFNISPTVTHSAGLMLKQLH